MKNRFLSRLFEKKSFLLVFSFLCAVTIWFTVSVNYTQEETKIIKDIPIVFDTSNLERYDLEVIEVLLPTSLKEGKLDVKVRGRRTFLAQISADNIVVTAMTNNISQSGNYTLTLRYDIDSTILGITFPSDNQREVEVRVDRIKEKSFIINEVHIEGNLIPADNHIIEKPFSNVEEIVVIGPETEIDLIDSVVVSAAANEIISSIKTYEGKINLYDKYGKEISQAFMKLDVNTENISVTVPVKMKKTLSIVFDLINVPEYYIKNPLKYTLSQSEIEVLGATEAITSTYPTDEYSLGTIDFTKITSESKSMKIPLMFSKGIEEANQTDSITITFDLSGISSKTIFVKTAEADIVFSGNSSGNSARITTDTINSVTVYGPTSQIKTILDSDMLITVDLSDRGSGFVGSYVATAVVSFKNKNRSWVAGSYEVNVNITAG